MMYIYTYRKHLVSSQIKLEDYWRIQELDLEWYQFNRYRSTVSENLRKLEEDDGVLIPQSVKILMGQAITLHDLRHIQDFLNYVTMKERARRRLQQTLHEELHDNLGRLSLNQRKQAKRERLIVEMLRLKIDELTPKLMYTADEFVEVLQGRIVDTSHRQTMGQVEDIKPYLNPNHPMIQSNVEIFKTLGKYISLELYYHPYIRHYVGRMYQDLVKVSTEPTQ